jgi:excisionase family DNA binding protein
MYLIGSASIFMQHVGCCCTENDSTIQMNNLKLVSIEETATALSLSPWTVRAHLTQGNIASVKVGRRRLIPVAEIDRIAQHGLVSLAKAG